MRAKMLEKCIGRVSLESGIASLVSFKDAANLVIGSALLILLVLLVQELSFAKGNRK
jgi:hypothetical protein